MYTISQTILLKQYHITAEAISKDRLGIKAEDIGTHSIWSLSTIAIFLVNTPIFVIMLVGRWSSDAFLYYIHK